MAKLNRIRVVLAERDLNNKWLSDKLGKDPATVSKWVTNTTQPSLEANDDNRRNTGSQRMPDIRL